MKYKVFTNTDLIRLTTVSKTTNTYEVRSASQNIEGFITKLIVLITLGILPIVGLCTVRPYMSGVTEPMVLEINMVDYTASSTNRIKDTLSVSIFETTTGDEYILNTTTGSFCIPLANDKHYFIFISKTGSMTQTVEFQTAGSENSQSRTFYVDYDPIEIDFAESGVLFNPTSVVKFGNDMHSTVEIEEAGVNIFYD